MVKLYFKGECTKFINLDDSGAPEGEPLKVSAAPKLEGVEALPADATEQGDDIF